MTSVGSWPDVPSATVSNGWLDELPATASSALTGSTSAWARTTAAANATSWSRTGCFSSGSETSCSRPSPGPARAISALTELGTPAGTVVVAKDGASWGYGPFLSRRGADEDDVLVV